MASRLTRNWMTITRDYFNFKKRVGDRYTAELAEVDRLRREAREKRSEKKRGEEKR